MHTKPQSQSDVLNTTMIKIQENRLLIHDISAQLILLEDFILRDTYLGLTFTE